MIEVADLVNLGRGGSCVEFEVPSMFEAQSLLVQLRPEDQARGGRSRSYLEIKIVIWDRHRDKKALNKSSKSQKVVKHGNGGLPVESSKLPESTKVVRSGRKVNPPLRFQQ